MPPRTTVQTRSSTRLSDEAKIVDTLFDAVTQELFDSNQSPRDVIHLGRSQRVAIFDAEFLRDNRQLEFVAFFGRRRQNVAQAIVDEIFKTDQALLNELAQMPAMAAYASIVLPDSNWANLVVIKGETAFEQLRASETHQHAARKLSPDYYEGVRLHFGVRSPDGSTIFNKTNTYEFLEDKEDEECCA